MKKLLTIITALFFLGGCGAYLDQKPGGSNQSADFKTLQLVSGGYVSSDTANDITPFVYHDSSGDSFLFFASDRGNTSGSYDIYYSEMSGDLFLNPVKLSSPVNTTESEICPILFTGYGSTTNTYITFLRDDAGVVVTYTFSYDGSAFSFGTSPVEVFTNSNITAISPVLRNYSDGFWVDLSVTTGEAQMTQQYFSDGWFTFNETAVTLPQTVRSVSGSMFNDSAVGTVEDITIYLMNYASGQNLQIDKAFYMGRDTNLYIYLTNSLDIPLFTSDANDKDPFIDIRDESQIYFASDRYTNATKNYDLYRYNTVDIYTYVMNNLLLTNIVITDPYAGMLFVTSNSTLLSTIVESSIVFADIQSAIDALSNTMNSNIDTILVFNETFSGFEADGLSNITISGGWMLNPITTNFSQSGKTTINGVSTNRGISIQNCAFFTVNGFSVTNGSASPNIGGLRIVNSFSNTVYKIDILGSSAFIGVGASISNSSFITLTNYRISGNMSGGIYINNAHRITLNGTNVNNNGSGLVLDNVHNATVMGLIQSNSNTGNGAGVLLTGGSYSNTITASILANTSSSGYGGGVYIETNVSDCTIDASIEYNEAVFGGGVFGSSEVNTINSAKVKINLPNDAFNSGVTRIYVDGGSGDDGNSGTHWTNAVSSLQEGLNKASSENASEIWVTTNEQPIYLSLILSNMNDLLIMGGYQNGFVPTASDELTLLNAFGGSTIMEIDDSQYITISNLRLSAGYSEGGFSGGLTMNNTHRSVIHVTTDSNQSSEGGGLSVINSHSNNFYVISLTNTSFSQGGGLFMSNSHYNSINIYAENNYADLNGGGIALINSDNNSFYGGANWNIAYSGDGGGVYVDKDSTGNTFLNQILPTLNIWLMHDNSATLGGGIILDMSNNTVLNFCSSPSECAITNNSPDNIYHINW